LTTRKGRPIFRLARFPTGRGRVDRCQRLLPKTLVCTAAWLLLLFESGQTAVADASLLIVVFPRAFTFTTSVTVKVSSLASRGASQVTVPALPAGGVVMLPWLELALT